MRNTPNTIDSRVERALENAEGFFMKTGKLHRATLELARRLDEARIPYAIAGAMALSGHGYERMTADVGILLTRAVPCFPRTFPHIPVPGWLS